MKYAILVVLLTIGSQLTAQEHAGTLTHPDITNRLTTLEADVAANSAAIEELQNAPVEPPIEPPVEPPVEPPDVTPPPEITLPPLLEWPEPNIIVQPGDSVNNALRRAGPGDHVRVMDGTYSTRVEFVNSGTEENPIWFSGQSRDGVIFTGIKDGARFWRYNLEFEVGTGRTVSYVNVKDVSCRMAKIHGIFLINTHHLRFENVAVSHASSYGIFGGGFSAGGSDNIIIGNSFFFKNGTSGTGAGARIGQRSKHWASNWFIYDSVFHSNATVPGASGETGTGINVNAPEDRWKAGDGRLTQDITVWRVAAYGNGSTGLSSQLPKRVRFIDCISFDNNNVGTPNGEGHGIRHGFSGKDNAVIRCWSFNNLADGVLMENQSGGLVQDCTVYNNRGFGIRSTTTIESSGNTSFGNSRANYRGVVQGSTDGVAKFPTLVNGDFTTYAQLAVQLGIGE